MSPRDRLEAYLVRGLEVSLAPDGRLRVRGPRWLVDLARPSLVKHREGLIEYLRPDAHCATDHESAVRAQVLECHEVSPACAWNVPVDPAS